MRFIKERALDELRRGIRDNLSLYRGGDFGHLTLDPSLNFESDIEVDEKVLSKLKAPTGEDLFDTDNCTLMVKALSDLSPYEAADERLWVMLSHTLMLDHARLRWPIPKSDDAAIKHIQSHFFASTQRQLERDNVASRLWWMGHLCQRVQGLSLKQSLDILLHRSDVRANIVERPTTAQSIPVFTALLHKLAKSYNGNQKLFERKAFRTLMVKLNGVGGYKLLDALDSKSVEKFIVEIITQDLKMKEQEI
nr:DUF6339 family protein [Bradyrhizobium sp. 139]